MRRIVLLLALLVLAPPAAAQPTGAIDATITLADGAAPQVDAPAGLVRMESAEPGERYAFNLTLEREYTTLEVRARGFDIERPRQVFPHLLVGDDEYPLFEAFPHERIWEVDGAANVFHVSGTAEDVVLRLGITGPRNVTLFVERDVTPPSFEIGPVSELQHFSFYQETNTTELALADLQIRKLGAEEWVRNPTPVHHFRQRFPVQGLDADTEYEARVVFTDWAGNEAMSPTYRVRTTPEPVGPPITITPLSPEPNATILPGSVTIRARVESPEAPIPPGGVRLFFDKREVTDKLTVQGDEVVFIPDTILQPGPHSVAFEATNDAGGKGLARWSFEVEGAAARKETPAAAIAPLALALGCALLLAGRGRQPRA